MRKSSTIILGVAATSNVGNQTVKLDGPGDVRLSFGSSKASSSNTSTPTELKHRDTLKVDLSGSIDTVVGGFLKTNAQ